MADPTATKAEVSYLSMSDEELSNISSSMLDVTPPAEVVEEVVEEVTEPKAPAPVEEVVEEEVAEEKSAEPEAKEEVTPEAAKEPEEKAPEVDYKAEYSKIFTPFKANGKEIAVNSAEDAISLMQMGANYNKKMAALKPNLKLMKLLENNGLLSEEKISYLIDLEKKNPEAISRLIKESGVDPMDLDADKASGYKPNTYTVDDREIELDTVLDELSGTPSYTRTLDIVSTKWDSPSKQVIAGSPQLLKVINAHVQSGIYDTIQKEVERERMFGRLNGLSDIEAYRQVGDVIHSRGGFAPQAQQGQQTPPASMNTAPKPSKVDEDKLKEKRRAASSTKPAGSSVTPADFNPLAMSDEEFSKTVNSRYL